MEWKIIDLNEDQANDIEAMLSEYDEKHIKYKIPGSAGIGIVYNQKLIAGAIGCMTAYRIFYVSTIFVKEDQRGKGFGRKLMESIEKRALSLGANLIRLDTFDWQGAEFYIKLGYEQVGHYDNEIDGFSEYFFIKRLLGKL